MTESIRKRTSLAESGDPMSEINVMRRLNFLRESSVRGIVFVPERWVKADPAMAKAVQELDWLKIAKPQ